LKAGLERVITLLVNGALARLVPGWRREDCRPLSGKLA
jgi:hypothetical protein